MTIQQLADAYIGHPREDDEGVGVYSKREAYKDGALKVLEKVEDVLLQTMEKGENPSVALRDLIDKLRGEL